jgi:hypothetical protein
MAALLRKRRLVSRLEYAALLVRRLGQTRWHRQNLELSL